MGNKGIVQYISKPLRNADRSMTKQINSEISPQVILASQGDRISRFIETGERLFPVDGANTINLHQGIYLEIYYLIRWL